MFIEREGAGRFQDSCRLSKGDRLVLDAAKDEAEDDRIDRTAGQGYLLGATVVDTNGYPTSGCSALCAAPETGIRLERGHTSDASGIERKCCAVPRTDLHDVAGEPVDECLPMRIRSSSVHSRPDAGVDSPERGSRGAHRPQSSPSLNVSPWYRSASRVEEGSDEITSLRR